MAVTTAGLADVERTEGRGLADTWRHFRAALLLGWRVESNWADPVLFSIYTVIKPISSMLLLTVMVQIVGGSADTTARTFVIIGSALWALLVSGLAGPAWGVLDDRERYRTLKYLYTSPAAFLVLLAGRGGARLVIGAIGTLVAIGSEYQEPAKTPMRPFGGRARQNRHMKGRSRSSSLGAA